eukprot:4181017-Prymnesium_polylepis.1
MKAHSCRSPLRARASEGGAGRSASCWIEEAGRIDQWRSLSISGVRQLTRVAHAAVLSPRNAPEASTWRGAGATCTS